MKIYKFAALLVIAGLCIGISLTLGANEHGLHLGASPPMANVTMKGVDGKAHTIAGVKGKKGTLVVFSCNACPFVKKWEDRIVGIGNAYQKKVIGSKSIDFVSTYLYCI